MPTYFVDDAGDNSDGSTWAKAYTSIQSLDTAVAIASGDLIYIGADSNCTDAAANLIVTGPAATPPVSIISSTVGTGTTVSYSVGTGKQVDTDSGAYDITLDGAFALYGIKLVAGDVMYLTPDTNEGIRAEACTFIFGTARYLDLDSAASTSDVTLVNCVVDLTPDGSQARATQVVRIADTAANIVGMTFVNAAYRTATVFSFATTPLFTAAGCDFSGFTNATTCELFAPSGLCGTATMSNCLTAATWTPFDATYPNPGGSIMLTNVGPADAPTYLLYRGYFGDLLSSAAIYRTGGATVEGDACSWLITTTAACAEGAPFYTPWIYGTVSSTGSKTFDLYITNDTADFTDAECWLEVEYLSTSDEAIWALATDQRATITATAAAQTDDTTSTWNGTGPSFTYKQKLSVSATVNETGQYRARVAVGVASIASSRYFYVDPKVTVS